MNIVWLPSAHMLLLGNRADSLEAGKKMAEQSIQDGKAWEKFRQLVIAQGGNVEVVDKPDQLPQAKYVEVVKSSRRGYLSQIHARLIGEASVLLGAGRSKKTDPVDHAVGIVVHHKVGDLVDKDSPLFTLYANDQTRLGEAQVACPVRPSVAGQARRSTAAFLLLTGLVYSYKSNRSDLVKQVCEKSL